MIYATIEVFLRDWCAGERATEQATEKHWASSFFCVFFCLPVILFLLRFMFAYTSFNAYSFRLLFFFSFKFSTQFGHEMWMQRCYANWLTAVTFRLEDVVWSVVLFHWPLKCIFHMHISGLLFRLSFWFENSSLLLSFRLPTQFHTLNGIIYCSRYDGEWSSDGINAIVTNLKKTDILSCA